MNAELKNLLSEAGVTGHRDWRNVVTLYNYAPIPAPPLRVDISGWMRGFNLVIVKDGHPEHFVKCRPTSDAVLDRETTIRTALAGDRPGKLSVSAVRHARSSRIAVQVSPFLRGPTYGQIVHAQSSEQYVEMLAAVLQGAAELAEVAQRELLKQPRGTISVPAIASEILAEVAMLASLDDAQKAALAEVVLEVGEVPSIPQHGDFWWQNLIMVDGHLFAIDFDSYGDVRVPLFDDLTLTITTMAVRAGGTVEGLTRLLSSDPEARACHRVLTERARLDGVAPSKLDGLLVYYLANMATTVHRRGGLGFSAPHIAAARYAAERLAMGERGLLSVR